MQIKDIIKWLKGFDGDAELSIVVANPKERIVHKVNQVFYLTDIEAVMVETVESEPMDEIKKPTSANVSGKL